MDCAANSDVFLQRMPASDHQGRSNPTAIVKLPARGAGLPAKERTRQDCALPVTFQSESVLKGGLSVENRAGKFTVWMDEPETLRRTDTG